MRSPDALMQIQQHNSVSNALVKYVKYFLHSCTKAHKEVQFELYPFLTSGKHGVQDSASGTTYFIPGNNPPPLPIK